VPTDAFAEAVRIGLGGEAGEHLNFHPGGTVLSPRARPSAAEQTREDDRCPESIDDR
jgi:hypothetical protein